MPQATPSSATALTFVKNVHGIRYQVIQVPTQVPITEMRSQEQTTYRQQITTEQVQHQQVYHVPVTQYQVVSTLHNRWNPFAEPYWTHHYEPVTTWQQQVRNGVRTVAECVPTTAEVEVNVTRLVPQARKGTRVRVVCEPVTETVNVRREGGRIGYYPWEPGMPDPQMKGESLRDSRTPGVTELLVRRVAQAAESPRFPEHVSNVEVWHAYTLTEKLFNWEPLRSLPFTLFFKRSPASRRDVIRDFTKYGRGCRRAEFRDQGFFGLTGQLGDPVFCALLPVPGRESGVPRLAE